jgi:hypothetical protein
MLIRRTVPAMAATLAVYIGAVAAMPLWIWGHLTSAVHATPAFDLSSMSGLGLRPDGTLRVFSKGPSEAWVLSNHVVTSTGQVISANPQYCSHPSRPRSVSNGSALSGCVKISPTTLTATFGLCSGPRRASSSASPSCSSGSASGGSVGASAKHSTTDRPASAPDTASGCGVPRLRSVHFAVRRRGQHRHPSA